MYLIYFVGGACGSRCGTYMWRLEENLRGSQSFVSNMWIPGVKLKSSGLVPSAATHWAAPILFSTRLRVTFLAEYDFPPPVLGTKSRPLCTLGKLLSLAYMSNLRKLFLMDGFLSSVFSCLSLFALCSALWESHGNSQWGSAPGIERFL